WLLGSCPHFQFCFPIHPKQKPPRLLLCFLYLLHFLTPPPSAPLHAPRPTPQTPRSSLPAHSPPSHSPTIPTSLHPDPHSANPHSPDSLLSNPLASNPHP